MPPHRDQSPIQEPLLNKPCPPITVPKLMSSIIKYSGMLCVSCIPFPFCLWWYCLHYDTACNKIHDPKCSVQEL